MNSSKENKTLGRGLSALLGDMGDYGDSNTDRRFQNQSIDIDYIKPGKMQPRQYFDPEKMETLTNSIKQKGVLQPLVVRKLDDDFFEIIAGERRWRAAQAAGLTTIPVVEIICTDEEALEIGLIENLQRDDLNPMEEAESFQRLIDDHKKTQEEIAFSISKSRSYVANMLRLNGLPEPVKALIREGKLSAGHARSIAKANDIEQVAQKIIQDKLSVRDTENLVRRERQPAFNQPTIDPDIDMITRRIGERLGMKTKIQFTRDGGALTFYFQSYEQLDELVGYLSSV
ncbi:ParB/RepB/Spo0J family partition protein [Candidatus Finniella inopinata]|uniref:ParB/RepB/Spo0J family partition protein n=1 Tax=Candidatus Finniella inopinata TaxID=1696036 RepID=A0A4Q7DFN3_9PROT|nr:ParB/RepB/Spo0J family partition protein [Candidatus Finniella inopinata]RZI45601.1 ParB/RepB/Spo0J family partition protein [Candidatus Finniella inopinata]